MDARIFIPQPIPEQAVEELRRLAVVEVFEHLDRPISRAELLERVPGKTVLYSLGGVSYDREVLDAAADVRMIVSMQSSPGKVDMDVATERGIIVTGAPAEINSTPVAELAMALTLGLACRLVEADRFVREGRWRQKQSMAFVTAGLDGKRMGIFGFGAIGRAVAARARGFGMEVTYHKRSRLTPEQERELDVTWRGRDELFADADVVVLAAPLTDETRGLVDRRRLAGMRPSAFLINVSRSPVVIDEDLADALRRGVIAGAGLDVHASEPPDPDAGPHPALRDLSSVIVTPHIGTAAIEARQAKAAATIECVTAFLRGQRPPRVLNPAVYADGGVG